MSLVNAKCPNCGQQLKVEESNDAAICEYCGSAFIVEKAIKNYNITNNITAGVVNIYGDAASDFEIRGGVLEKYKGKSTNVVIPDSVIAIGVAAFRDCIGIESVTIPESVTQICHWAFQRCSRLKSIDIPDSVIDMDFCIFSGCSSLERVKLPRNIEEIGDLQFCDCAKLKSIDIPSSVTKIGDAAFSGCSSLEKLLIPTSVVSLGSNFLKGCTSIKTITIHGGIEKIPWHAFDGCTHLETVRIEQGVFWIGFGAFDHCENLKTIYFADSVHVFDLGYKLTDFPNLTIIASDEWKSKNFNLHESLVLYAPKKTGGCYVATAVYGSYDCPKVWTLRRFRDYKLDSTWYGKVFIAIYYAVSPTIVKWFGHTQWFNKMWRDKLDKMVKNLQEQGFEDTPYQDKY